MPVTASATTLRREERREAIVRTAKEIFFAEGYAATSMATIAARVGGSKGTLYNYFTSKEELFEAVVQDFLERNSIVFSKLNVAEGDVDAALASFGGQILRLMLSDDAIAMYRLIAGESGRFPEIGATYYEAVMRRGKQRLVERFAAAMDAGRIRRSDPAIAAQHFVDLCLSGLHRRRLWNIGPAPSEAEIDANIDQAVRAFLDGYRVK
ncbi:MAG: TetR/AcrR family transcriptional regulator [Hyphomonadaceae bacterium]|nr:TetR/AcrR family transcriptional regulator [Hyphomonadaceae bacterium]